MNSKALIFIKNYISILTSNLVSFFTSILVILIVPKVLGVVEYGYWQVYLLYASYVGFLHLGWNDGVYLKNGGKFYDDLNKTALSKQFILLSAFQVIVACLLSLFAVTYVTDEQRILIFILISICLIITNIRYFFLYVLQCTNKIKEYSQLIIIDKITYCLLIGFFLLIGMNNFKVLIIADLCGRLISLLFAMYRCREIVLQQIKFQMADFIEVSDNIRIGIKLMFSNISSILIVGTVRLGIEKSFDVVSFGKISLTLSISNMFMLFINSIGLILFPILRRSPIDSMSQIFKTMRAVLVPALFVLLIAYYPIKYFLIQWLPSYQESIFYLGILFPILILEGQNALLTTPFFNTLRLERKLLKINLLVLLVSIILTIFTAILLKSMVLSAVSIIILLTLRTVFSQLYLMTKFKLNLIKDIIIENLLIACFVLISINFNNLIGFTIYLLLLIIFLLTRAKAIKVSFKHMINLTKK
ncbi:lipopolysaccharide biosynthesis protein [Priestia megaterium]|uniref:lipopolysaccharide biosynthesis protein n=1 Tax=Priestia megaterium TaxID=1404 RepID=UPI00221E7C99|nr:hypothetical protein OHU75_18475 [Priestia megaterium]